jgi:hypothetical protein
MSYDENKISDLIDGGLHQKEQLILSSVKLSLDFAEWIDINGIRYGKHEWKYKGDNFSKKWTTKQMFDKWQKVSSNEP